MRRQKRYTVKEAHDIIFGQKENPKHNEVEEAIDEDSESEEEEKMDEVTDATCRPHADSSSELASTSSTTEEEWYEVEDWSPDEEVESADEEDSEAEMEEMSEVEDYTCYDEEESSTDEEEMEEEDAAEEEYFQSKDEKLIWSSTPPSDGRMLTAERETSSHGPTAYARSRISDIKSTFELFLPKPIEQIVLNMTNKEGPRVYGRKWKRINGVDLQAYVGMLILAGLYRSSKEDTSSLWHAETGRAIFRATMTLKIFHTIPRVIRFDDKETRADRRAQDKLGPIRDVWDKWVSLLPSIYDPGSSVVITALEYNGVTNSVTFFSNLINSGFPRGIKKS